MPKALSAIVAVVLLLMMTVGAAGLAYVFISGLQKSGEESTQGQLSSMQEAISSCMAIDSVYSNKVYLRNCGDGIVDNASLKVYMDDEPISLSMSPSNIEKGEVGTISLYGIWDLAPYTTHKLKIQNDATSVSKRVSAEPRKDDLVGGWDFDDGSGTTARDWSGKGNGGTLTNFQFDANDGWVQGKFGGGLKFDGSNDYVNVSSLSGFPTGSAPRTMDVLIRPNDVLTQYSPIIAYGTGINTQYFGLEINNSRAHFSTYGGAVGNDLGGNTVLSVGNWYRIDVAYDGSTAFLYLNGVLDATGPKTVNTVLSGFGFQIGRKGSCVGCYTNGIIDDVRIYSKALTPDELVNLKAA